MLQSSPQSRETMAERRGGQVGDGPQSEERPPGLELESYVQMLVFQERKQI